VRGVASVLSTGSGRGLRLRVVGAQGLRRRCCPARPDSLSRRPDRPVIVLARPAATPGDHATPSLRWVVHRIQGETVTIKSLIERDHFPSVSSESDVGGSTRSTAVRPA
jgi:hypothetical protein